MRHLSYVLCASIAACGYSALALATTNPPLAFTLDLLSPCTPSGCGTTIHATDIDLNILADAFSYAPGPANSFVATMDVSMPVVCDEIASGGTLGATSSLRLAPTFTNGAPGGLLEFNGGGTSIVDLNGVTYDGSSPSGVAASYSNSGAPQVVCYQINAISGGPLVYAVGPSGIFSSNFESNHAAGEPWVSVQSVNSPSGLSRPSGPPNGAFQSNDLAYVVQVHNALSAIGWHLSFGYDSAFFDPANNGMVAPQWCVLSSAQPGIPSSCGSSGSMASPPGYTLSSGDIQSATNSVYLQVVQAGSSAATSGWSTLTTSLYPAVAAVFPPFGTYPQRFDDKVAVASAFNLPTLNIGSIVCNNDTTSTSCVIRDQDGNAVPAALTFADSISGGGTVNVDPLAYVVDPAGGTTLPGNSAQDVLTISNVSCADPSGILASPIAVGNFTTSPSAQGGKALGFGFSPSGSPNFPYVAGTATCSGTFAAPGFVPALSTTQSFTITMNQSAVGSVVVTASPAGQTANPGGSLTYSVVVANAANATLSNVGVTDAVPANAQSMSWTCSAVGATCPAASGSGAVSQTISSLPVGATVTYAVSATLVGINTFVSAPQITDAASISVPGGSCAGGNCNSSANIATVPIIAFGMSENPQTYANVGDPVTYTITLANQGGTNASGLTLGDPGPAGVTFGAWTCTAIGATSNCPNPTGTGSIAESGIAIDAGGSVTYTLSATTSVSSGNITNQATAGPGGTVCVAGNCTAQQILTTGL